MNRDPLSTPCDAIISVSATGKPLQPYTFDNPYPPLKKVLETGLPFPFSDDQKQQIETHPFWTSLASFKTVINNHLDSYRSDPTLVRRLQPNIESISEQWKNLYRLRNTFRTENYTRFQNHLQNHGQEPLGEELNSAHTRYTEATQAQKQHVESETNKRLQFDVEHLKNQITHLRVRSFCP